MTSSKWLTVIACRGRPGARGCGLRQQRRRHASSGGGGDLSGSIRIDGSSTVAPLTEAIAEEFQAENPGVKVTVGTSGTGGGFEKFCAGETDISDASRAIEPEEVEACKKDGIGYEDVHVATDALTVMINNENPVTCLTVDQLGAIWGPDSKISNWSEIPGLKEDFDEELALFGPGTDSGTFDYFTEEINGEEGVDAQGLQQRRRERQRHGHRRRGLARRHGLRRLLLLHGERRQAESARSRRRQRLRRPRRSKRPRTAPTRRSAGRCSSTRATRR